MSGCCLVLSNSSLLTEELCENKQMLHREQAGEDPVKIRFLFNFSSYCSLDRQ